MLGHLVYGRYSAGGETAPVIRDNGWIRRMFRALFGRRD
jgi:hypothetical protein